jgi:hypothetical protein
MPIKHSYLSIIILILILILIQPIPLFAWLSSAALQQQSGNSFGCLG